MVAKTKKEQIRAAAEADLETFIHLVHPGRMLGSVHQELIRWWTREDAKSHQLVLLPRDHAKSAMLAYRCAWTITRDPTVRILYLSSTSNLATKQLKFIKDILTSDVYRQFWPEMVNVEESKREKWTETEITVDHPLRKSEAIRDPTVFAGGLTTNFVGMHCDVAALDDVIVMGNAYTQEGRDKVMSQYSLLASIEASDSKEWVVGTRYFAKDLYFEMQQMGVEEIDDDGNVIGFDPLYEVFERAVEVGGQFLWPKMMRYDGKEFGFDAKILARKKAQYLNKTQFQAQYYNNPNDPDSAVIGADLFQYYDPKYIHRSEGRWFFKNERLNIFAGVDFAYSLARRADFTCVIVVGVDRSNNYYILEIDRFKTDKISDYFAHILRLHQKWDFRKIRAEVTAAQSVIVKDLKENYIRKHGLALSVDEFKPTRHGGSKEERIEAILQPRYNNKQIWHYVGGNCQTLEEELVLKKPPHDDVKDCLATVIDACVPPSVGNMREYIPQTTNQRTSRFGGVI